MAISDKYLQGNLNRVEMDALQKDREFTIKGIPMSVFDRLSREEKERILGLGPDESTIKGIPKSIFNNLSPEEQSQILGLSGNLNRTEMNQLRESEPSAGNFAEIKSLIGRLMAAGASRAEITAAIQDLTRGNLNRAEIGKLIAAGESRSEMMSPAEGQFGGSPHGEGPFWRQYNQGGIVSLRHLTRPIGI